MVALVVGELICFGQFVCAATLGIRLTRGDTRLPAACSRGGHHEKKGNPLASIDAQLKHCALGPTYRPWLDR